MRPEDGFRLVQDDAGGSPAEHGKVRPHDHRSEIVRIVQLALAFCVIFMPFSAAQNFQTSQADPVMGSRALSILYLTFTFSNLISGQIVQRIGLKCSMFFGSLTYIAFVFSNVQYTRWIVFSSSALLGLGASVLWTAQGAFVTRVSNLHDLATGKVSGSSLGYFNGIFFSIFQANQLLGNLITAVMFQYAFAPSSIFKICSIICAVGSMLLLVVRAPPLDKRRAPSLVFMLRSIAWQFNDHRLLLLVPFMLLNGATISFIVGDVAAFASSNRIRFLVMACWGGFDAFGSILFGRLSDRIGRVPVIVFGVIAHCLLTAMLLYDDVIRKTTVSLFAIASVLGFVDAVYNTSVYAIIGKLFIDPESAFANFKLFQSGMIAATFFYREFTDLRARLNVILLLIFLSSVCLCLLRIRVHSL